MGRHFLRVRVRHERRERLSRLRLAGIGAEAVAGAGQLGAAYEFATGWRLASGDFESGKTGAVRMLGQLEFAVNEKQRLAR